MPDGDESAPSRPAFEPLSPAILLPLIASLLPLMLFRRSFALLYWFHDDWDLTSDLDRLGYWKWIQRPHAETFSPLFKALWLAAIHVVQGSYLGMILLLWLTHLAILLMFAYILSQTGFGAKAQAAAILTAGVPWSNIETLGWATQWSPLLCTLFWLAAWAAAIRFLVASRQRDAVWLALAPIATVASMLCFVRGSLSGVAVALFVLIASVPQAKWRSRNYLAAGLVALTFACVLIYRYLLSVLPQVAAFSFPKLQAMLSYAGYYLLLNPLFHLLPIPRKAPDTRALLIAGSCKVLLVAAGFKLASKAQRAVLITLLFFDFGAAVLLAFGRFGLGLDTSIASRYQYISLLCLAPFVGISFAALASPVGQPARSILYVAVMVSWGLLLGYPWARHSERWSGWRGIEVREAVSETPDDQRFGVPAITAGRARELIQKYKLH